jgi:hypothetical protein
MQRHCRHNCIIISSLYEQRIAKTRDEASVRTEDLLSDGAYITMRAAWVCASSSSDCFRVVAISSTRRFQQLFHSHQSSTRVESQPRLSSMYANQSESRQSASDWVRIGSPSSRTVTVMRIREKMWSQPSVSIPMRNASEARSARSPSSSVSSSGRTREIVSGIGGGLGDMSITLLSVVGVVPIEQDPCGPMGDA